MRRRTRAKQHHINKYTGGENGNISGYDHAICCHNKASVGGDCVFQVFSTKAATHDADHAVAMQLRVSFTADCPIGMSSAGSCRLDSRASMPYMHG